MTLNSAEALRRQIRELRAEMRAAGIRKTSCFNGGLDRETYRANAELFRLNTELERQASHAGH